MRRHVTKTPPNGGVFFLFQKRRCGLLRRGLLDGGVEAGLLAGGGVLLEDALGNGLVDGFLSLLEGLLGDIDLLRRDGLAGGLDGALEHTLHDLVALGLLLGHAHVLLGILLDRHSGCLDDEKRLDVSPFLCITAS